MDGGFALKLPVDAIAEFRILTQSAPPEYGGTGGATTSVVTRSGGNPYHGSLYEFLRNDAFDARNFFSAEVEPLNQHQFGGTIGGPVRRTALFFFGYYEGFRNKQGITTTATVPTAKERQGDFSEMGRAAAQPRRRRRAVPGQQASRRRPSTRWRATWWPCTRSATSRRRSIARRWSARTSSTRPAAASTSTSSPNDQLFARYSYSGGNNINPDLGARHRRAGLPDARRHRRRTRPWCRTRASSRRR